MQNAKQEFLYQSSESFSREYYNMENEIFGFQFEPMCIKQTRPNYSFGSDQDEAEIQYDRLSTLEWCNCKKCEKMSTSLECICYHEIPAVKAFHLKLKARLSWNTAVLEFFRKLCRKSFLRRVFLRNFVEIISQCYFRHF